MGSVQCGYHIRICRCGQFDAVLEGITFREESESKPVTVKVIIDYQDKPNPVIQIADNKAHDQRIYIPVGAHISVEEGEKLQTDKLLLKYLVQLVKPVTSPVVCHV